MTDANVVLGRLPARTLGGGIALDRARAERALAPLARALRLRSAAAAAEAVLAVANAHMEAALRLVSVERGLDPRGAALVAFGGAGGLHACALAESLGADAVVFPEHAGVLCALGALSGEETHERSRTVLADSGAHAALARAMSQLEREVGRAFGRGAGPVALERRALARYAGQSHELELEYGPGLERRFHAEHHRRYGFARAEAPIEVVTLEARGTRPRATPRPAAPRERAARAVASAEVATVGGRSRRVPAWRFESLPARVRGPAIVLQDGATLWIAPGWIGARHARGSLVLRRERRS